MPHPSLKEAVQLSTRAAAAGALSVALARALEFEQPTNALVTAVLVMDLTAAETRRLGLPRLGGTLLGGLIGAVLGHMLPPSSASIGAGILVTMLLCHLVRLAGGARVAGYNCGIVLLNAGDFVYAYHRTVETALGITLAILVSFVPKLIRNSESGASTSDQTA
jgi:uncharacterized membrane protein YccC